MVWCMHRTNVYLTREQEAALAARARAEGVSRSDVLRAILDRALGLDGDDPVLDAAMLDAADLIAGRAHALFADDPDLSSR